MNVIGKWKLNGIRIPTENGIMCYTDGNIPEAYIETYEENKDMLLEFLEDGTLNTIVAAVSPYLEMAEEEGLEVREDGFLVAYSTQWEDRDGRIYYNGQIEGTIMDEQVDPFVELLATDDGCILYNFGMLLYKRV